MLIHIVGPGTVGKATGGAFVRFGHEVIYSDYQAINEARMKAGMHFICTPENAVPSVVEEMQAQEIGGDIVIRSTTPPGSIARLAFQVKRNLWHNPEFLRAATAQDDVLNMTYTLVGFAPGHRALPCLFYGFEETYGRMGVNPVLCTSTESELAKLITNAYLATQISFWNEIKRLCDEFHVNSHAVARLVTKDSRITHYGAFKHGAAYDGHCLPKDIQQVLSVMQQYGDAPLLTAVQLVNKCMGGR